MSAKVVSTATSKTANNDSNTQHSCVISMSMKSVRKSPSLKRNNGSSTESAEMEDNRTEPANGDNNGLQRKDSLKGESKLCAMPAGRCSSFVSRTGAGQITEHTIVVVGNEVMCESDARRFFFFLGE